MRREEAEDARAGRHGDDGEREKEEEARKKSRRCGRVLLIRLLREEAGVRAVSGTAEGRRRKSGGLLFCQECGMMCQYSNEYDY